MNNHSNIRVLLIEDHFIARLGTATYLSEQSGIDLVGQASDGVSGLAEYRRLRPDVVVTDLKMPQMDGVTLTAILLKETPPAKVLLLTHYEGHENILLALKAGALGYLTKDTCGEEILRAIQRIAVGLKYLSPSVAGCMAERVLAPVLSPRELQVLGRMYEGRSNREIAIELSLTEKTAGMYVSKILNKLDAKSRTEAVRFALERGIISVNDWR